MSSEATSQKNGNPVAWVFIAAVACVIVLMLSLGLARFPNLFAYFIQPHAPGAATLHQPPTAPAAR